MVNPSTADYCIEYEVIISSGANASDGWSDELNTISRLLSSESSFERFMDEQEKTEIWKRKMSGFFDKKYHKKCVKKITSKAYYSQLIKC